MWFNWKSFAAAGFVGIVAGIAYGLAVKDAGIVTSAVVFAVFGFAIGAATTALDHWFAQPAVPPVPPKP